MENLRNIINVELIENEKDCLKWTSNQVICLKRYWAMI